MATDHRLTSAQAWEALRSYAEKMVAQALAAANDPDTKPLDVPLEYGRASAWQAVLLTMNQNSAEGFGDAEAAAWQEAMIRQQRELIDQKDERLSVQQELIQRQEKTIDDLLRQRDGQPGDGYVQ